MRTDSLHRMGVARRWRAPWSVAYPADRPFFRLSRVCDNSAQYISQPPVLPEPRQVLINCRQILRSHLACTSPRSSPRVWRDYLLPLLFLKYISDEWQELYIRATHDAPGDLDYIATQMGLARFHLPLIGDSLHGRVHRGRRTAAIHAAPALASFDALWQKRDSPELGAWMDWVFAALEQANPRPLHQALKLLSFNDVHRLGNAEERQALWRALLQELAQLDLRSEEKRAECRLLWRLLVQECDEHGLSRLSQPPLQGLASLLWQLADPPPNSSFADPFCADGGLLQEIMQQTAQPMQWYVQEAELRRAASARLGFLLDPLRRVQWQAGGAILKPLQSMGGSLQPFLNQVADLGQLPKRWHSHLASRDQHQRFSPCLMPPDKPELACIAHMLACARPAAGKVLVLVSGGCLFRAGLEQQLRARWLEQGWLTAVITLPARLQGKRLRSQHLLMFDTGRKPTERVLLADVSHFAAEGQQYLPASQIAQILSVWRAARQPEPQLPAWACLCSAGQLAAQQQNWLPAHHLQAMSLPGRRQSGELGRKVLALEQQLQHLQQQMLQLLGAGA